MKLRFVETLRCLFSRPRSFHRVSMEEFRQERIRLGQLEERLTQEVEGIERRKRDLFEKGKNETSERQQGALARKIQELAVGAKAKDQQLAVISRQLRGVAGLIALKEGLSLAQDLGLSSLVATMDIGRLEKVVEKATVQGRFQMERFARLMKALEFGEAASPLGEEEDTLAIVSAMQEAKALETETPGAPAVEEGMKKVERILEDKDRETHVEGKQVTC